MEGTVATAIILPRLVQEGCRGRAVIEEEAVFPGTLMNIYGGFQGSSSFMGGTHQHGRLIGPRGLTSCPPLAAMC